MTIEDKWPLLSEHPALEASIEPAIEMNRGAIRQGQLELAVFDVER